MKGKTEIILTNVKTGEVEKYTEFNIVTDATEDASNNFFYGINSRCVYSQSALTSGSEASTITPVTDMYTLFGGIKCYPQPIEEQPNHFYEEITHEPTAYSGNDGYTGEDSKRGSFNTIESGAVEDGFKFVFDFPTSAGNGTISCICMTHADSGKGHYNNWSYLMDGHGGNNRGFKTNLKLTNGNSDEPLYGCKNVLAYSDKAFIMNNNNTSKLVKVNAWAKSNGFNHLLRSDREGLPVLSSEEHVLDYTPVAFASSFADETFYVIKEIKNYNQLVWEHFDINFNLLGSGSWTFSGVNFKNNSNKHICYPICVQNTGSYIFVPRRSGDVGLYRCNINNNADVSFIECPVTEMDGATNGRDVDGEFWGCQVIIDKDGVAHPMDYANWMIPFRRIGTWAFGTYYNYNDVWFGASLIKNYLATINNLATPVVKTADKTMKIVYTITAD